MDIWWTVVTRTWTQCLQWTPTYHAGFWTTQSIHVCESWRRVIFWYIFSLLVDLRCSGSRFEVICAGPRHQVRSTCYLHLFANYTFYLLLLLLTPKTVSMSSAHIRMNKAQKTFSSPRLIHASSWNTLISTSAVLNTSHADCEAGILWSESTVSFANVFTKNRFKKTKLTVLF